MHLQSILHPAILLLLALTTAPSHAAKSTKLPKAPKNAILLSQVRSLTLHSPGLTTHRRVAAIPQLTCTGPACKYHTISTMRCTNAGSSYSSEDVEWSCTASLPEEFKLGSTEVVCEGYENRDDEYVLKGSCGVEYRLVFTDKGEEKYGKQGGGWFGGGSGKGKAEKPSYGREDTEGWTISSAVFALVFLGVLFWILYSAYMAYDPTIGGNRAPRRPGGGWGGGGGPDDPWDPPPPYPGKRYGSTRQQEGWRPGFWTGAGAGAAAGYMAGQRANRQPAAPQRSGGWFGGNSGEGSTSSRRTSSGSSARHESTGFGSTSRR